MALTYEESAALQSDMQFRGRIKVACLNFARYISNEASNVTAHTTRFKWAQSCFGAPDQTAMSIQPLVVMEDQVQLDGANVTDQNLQTATETAIAKML